jgi:hypothetical protein
MDRWGYNRKSMFIKYQSKYVLKVSQNNVYKDEHRATQPTDYTKVDSDVIEE